MKNKLTQKDIFLKLLRSEPDRWFWSYEVIKADTPFGWLGTSIDRQARDLVKDGTIQGRDEGKYKQFRANPPKEVIPIFVQGEKVSQKVIW